MAPRCYFWALLLPYQYHVFGIFTYYFTIKVNQMSVNIQSWESVIGPPLRMLRFKKTQITPVRRWVPGLPSYLQFLLSHLRVASSEQHCLIESRILVGGFFSPLNKNILSSKIKDGDETNTILYNNDTEELKYVLNEIESTVMQKMNLGSHESTVTRESIKSLRLCLFFVGNEKSSRKNNTNDADFGIMMFKNIHPISKKKVSKNKDQPNQKTSGTSGKGEHLSPRILVLLFWFSVPCHISWDFFFTTKELGSKFLCLA